MSIYNQFATDKSKEVEGVDVTFPANEDGSTPTFKIARMGKSNKRYTKAVERASRPYRRQIELKTLDEATSEKLMLEVFVETILLGWANIQGRDGKPLPFNRANAIKLMEDLPDLYSELVEEASKASRFREEQMEAESKN